MNLNLTKLAVPTLIGLVLAAGVVGWWVNEIINLSYRTTGTVFSEYAAQYPVVKNPHPSEIGFCDPAYKTPWAMCSLGKPAAVAAAPATPSAQ